MFAAPPPAVPGCAAESIADQTSVERMTQALVLLSHYLQDTVTQDGQAYAVTRWPTERVMHLRSILKPDEQVALMQHIHRLTKEKKAVTKPGCAFTILWTGDVLSQDRVAYDHFRAVVRKAATVAHHLEPAVAQDYNPIFEECYSYDAGTGKLKEHIDCILVLTLHAVTARYCGSCAPCRAGSLS